MGEVAALAPSAAGEVIRFVERRFPNMVSLGDVIERGHGKERVVDLRSPGFILTVPKGRKDPNMGTLMVRWRDLG